MSELTTRLDNMEVSIKKDIQSILEILRQQHITKRPIEHPKLLEDQTVEQAHASDDKQNLLMTSSCQPSGSDFSFELFGLDTKHETKQQQQTQQRSSNASTSQVHRSISQPECTNTATDKSLLRYVAHITHPHLILANKTRKK